MIGNLIKSLFVGGSESEVELPEWIGLILHSEDDLLKGVGHKYIRRVPTGNPKKPWRYFYKVSGGEGLGHHSEFIEGAAFKVAHNGKEGHFHILGVDGDKLRIKHDETGEESTLTKDALTSLLHKEHAQALGAHRERLKKELVAVSKHGSEKQKAKIQSEAAKAGISEDKPKSKEDLEYELVEQRSGAWVRDLAKKYGFEVKRQGQGLAIVDSAGAMVHPLIDKDVYYNPDAIHVERGLEAKRDEIKKKAARVSWIRSLVNDTMTSAGLGADYREAGLDSVLQEIDKIESAKKRVPDTKIKARMEELTKDFISKHPEADKLNPHPFILGRFLPGDINQGAHGYYDRLEHAALNAILKIRSDDKQTAKAEAHEKAYMDRMRAANVADMHTLFQQKVGAIGSVERVGGNYVFRDKYGMPPVNIPVDRIKTRNDVRSVLIDLGMDVHRA